MHGTDYGGECTGLGPNCNACRNFGDKQGAWCYLGVAGGKTWDYCNIDAEKCPDTVAAEATSDGLPVDLTTINGMVIVSASPAADNNRLRLVIDEAAKHAEAGGAYINTHYDSLTTFATSEAEDPSISFDLGEMVPVGAVKIWPRTDEYDARSCCIEHCFHVAMTNHAALSYPAILVDSTCL